MADRIGDEAMTCWMGVDAQGMVHFRFDGDSMTALLIPKQPENDEDSRGT